MVIWRIFFVFSIVLAGKFVATISQYRRPNFGFMVIDSHNKPKPCGILSYESRGIAYYDNRRYGKRVYGGRLGNVSQRNPNQLFYSVKLVLPDGILCI